MELSYTSILPPLIVLILGYLTHNIWLSLLVGIFSSAALATHFSFIDTIGLTGAKIWKNLEFNKFFVPSKFWTSWNAFICIFLLVLGILVTLIRHSGELTPMVAGSKDTSVGNRVPRHPRSLFPF